jgi:hypothetical protein
VFTALARGRFRGCFFWGCLLVSSAVFSHATTYLVGPNQALPKISDVPWERLEAGDEVRIHWQAEPYHEKWVICGEGQPESPIRVSGIPNAAGQLPVIDGRDAVCRPELDFWNEDRGIIKIGGTSHAPGVTPGHIVIENLVVRGARPPYEFLDKTGTVPYRPDAAGIYVESGEGITLRNCVLEDSGNGLFANGKDVLVEYCSIRENGIESRFTEHNSYTAAEGITFQFNEFGPLRQGCLGNNLKDRSACLVVRYNVLIGGSRQLDLVDAEDQNGKLVSATGYRETFVYGNILVERARDVGNEIVHYGGDSENDDWYRKGTLFFFHNTVASFRPDVTTLLRLSSNAESARVFNNVFWSGDPRGRLALSSGVGRFELQNNWISRGWVKTSRWLFLGGLVADGNLVGTEPGFVAPGALDFRLSAGSAARSSTVLDSMVESEEHRYRFTRGTAQNWRPLDAMDSRVIGAVQGLP